MSEQKKYSIKMVFERDGTTITINDVVDIPFRLEEYIFEHELENYDLVDFKLEEIKVWLN